MAMMKIYCDYCGRKWDVYERDNWNSDNARTCPHCFHKIDGQTWKHEIVPAFAAYMDLNKQLIKDTGAGSVRFSVDFSEDYFFPENKR